METITIPYELDNFKFPFIEIESELKKKQYKILIICNPNNPTGSRLSPENIIQLAKLSPETLIVIDELYEAFTGDSVLPIVNFDISTNIVVLRSLSKTAGLAGLRIGFGIGHPNIINRILRVTGPYDINSFAVTAAFAALKDQSYINNYVQEVKSAKTWLKKILKQNKVKHHIDGGNYLLIWPKAKPSEINQCLRSEGILVRNMKGKALIDGSIRVSIGTTLQMQQFWEAFRKHEIIEANSIIR